MSESSNVHKMEQKTLILNNATRIGLLGILPAEGNVVTMRVLREFRNDLSFTKDELNDCGIVIEGGQVSWTGESDREFEIVPAVLGIIKSTLKTLDAEQKITPQLLAVYELFME